MLKRQGVIIPAFFSFYGFPNGRISAIEQKRSLFAALAKPFSGNRVAS